MNGHTPPHIITVHRRAYTEPKNCEHKASQPPSLDPIKWLLTIDTETTVDMAQQLNFGCAQLHRLDHTKDGIQLTIDREYLFYADNLGQRDPAELETLKRYAHAFGVHLYSQKEFLDEILWGTAGRGDRLRATICGYNLGFDIPRLAYGANPSRGKKFPGFSFRFWGRFNEDGKWGGNPFRPRVVSQRLNQNVLTWELGKPPKASDESLGPDGKLWRGSFLDALQLVFVLTDQKMKLKGPGSACEAFGIEHRSGEVEDHGTITEAYIDYCRDDVTATAELAVAAMNELARHDTALHPTRAYTGATLGKSYLRSFGVKPPLVKWNDFPRSRLGQAMGAFHAGRSESRVRKHPVPVVLCDYTSMYPTICTLTGVWDYLVADTIETVDATNEFRNMLQAVAESGPKAILDPRSWKGLVGFANIDPRGDAVLPVRGDYTTHANGGMNVAVSRLTADKPLWYSFADIVASVLLTGQVPEILGAWKLQPVGASTGTQRPLRTGTHRIRPATRRLLQEAHRGAHPRKEQSQPRYTHP